MDLSTIDGIVLIDEVDAHLHVELQYDALPRLIALFPKIQFILTTHSPLVLLGLEKLLGSSGLQIIELPEGHSIGTERFAEFERSFEYYRRTMAFDAAIKAAVAEVSVPLVLTEGETDPKFLLAAIDLLGFDELRGKVQVEWVGAKRENAPQGFNTGWKGLNHTFDVLSANPGVLRRKVILLYDSDTRRQLRRGGGVVELMVPYNMANEKVTKGIENLFPSEIFEPRFYRRREEPKPDGGRTVVETLSKQEFCEWVCSTRRNPEL